MNTVYTSTTEDAVEVFLPENDSFVTNVPGFRFASIHISKRVPYPLVRVTYRTDREVGGKRLDLVKRVFIDHFEDKEMESAAQELAPKIVDYVSPSVMELLHESHESL